MLVLGFQGDRPRFTYKSVELIGTFSTGFAEFDQSWAVTDRQELDGCGRGSDGVMYEWSVDDPIERMSSPTECGPSLADEYLVTSWRESEPRALHGARGSADGSLLAFWG